MVEHDTDTGAPGPEEQEGPELQTGFYGFIATEPDFSDENGKPYLFFRAGQIRYDYAPDGTRTRLPTRFHNVVAFEGAAVHGHEHLAKRDVFLALGRLEEKPNPETGEMRTRFIANRFGPDLARMNIEIGSPRRLVDMPQAERAQEREHPNRAQARAATGFEPIEHEQPERDPHARMM